LAQTQDLRGEASFTTSGGYGRIVIRAEVESQVRMTSNILVVQFRQPVNIAVDRLGPGANEYIGAARRDPDGRAWRFARTQKVKVSSMLASDQLFIDLLPESWTGEPPALPRRWSRSLPGAPTRPSAWPAEARGRRAAQDPAVRVRVAAQPTFTRYIQLPELTGVSAERSRTLTLSFAGAAVRSVGCEAGVGKISGGSMPPAMPRPPRCNSNSRSRLTSGLPGGFKLRRR
jgi:hypothetical protein